MTLFPASPLRADDVSFEASVDRNVVTMNDTLRLQLAISGGGLNAPRPSLPPIPGFRAHSAGQSQNFSFVNGRTSSQVVYSYALEPQAPGDYTIPAFTLEAGGKTLSTPPIPVKVLSGASPPAAPPPDSAAPPPGRIRDLFVTAETDKKTAYVGEPLTLTFRFYSRARLASQPAYSPPDTTGFLAEDLPPQRQYTASLEGRNYAVVELKTALFPTAPGAFTIGPASLQCRVQDFSRGGDPFQSLFEEFFSAGQAVTLRTDPIAVRVLPLPEAGRPEGFRGDVGRYAVSAALDKSAVDLHEPVTLTVTVSGEGNVKALSAPALPPLDGFKVYETVSSLNVAKEDYRVRGSKVFKTVLKPDVTGALEVPPVSFGFFDPAAGAYRVARSEPLRLTVRPSPGGGRAAPAPAPLLEDLKVMGRDIRFIQRNARLRPRKDSFTAAPAFAFLNFFPALAFAGLWGNRLLRARRAADPLGLSFRRALRKARAGLARAEPFLREGNAPAYEAALQKILLDYLGDKLKRPARGLAWAEVEEELRRRAAPGETVAELEALWSGLDRARFAPAPSDEDGARRRGRALRDILQKLEGVWR
ncbi:MAG: BatD family protein [Elusimicrobiota bacterium]